MYDGTPDHGLEIKDLHGGLLIGDRHRLQTTSIDDIVAIDGTPVDEDVKRAALFQWIACCSLRSNSGNFGDEDTVFGVSTGEGARVYAIENALARAARSCPYYKSWLDEDRNIRRPLVLASDGFIPEMDSIEVCYEHGVTNLMTPRGALKEGTIRKRADELGIRYLTTRSNERPFVHR